MSYEWSDSGDRDVSTASCWSSSGECIDLILCCGVLILFVVAHCRFKTHRRSTWLHFPNLGSLVKQVPKCCVPSPIGSAVLPLFGQNIFVSRRPWLWKRMQSGGLGQLREKLTCFSACLGVFSDTLISANKSPQLGIIHNDHSCRATEYPSNWSRFWSTCMRFLLMNVSATLRYKDADGVEFSRTAVSPRKRFSYVGASRLCDHLLAIRVE